MSTPREKWVQSEDNTNGGINPDGTMGARAKEPKFSKPGPDGRNWGTASDERPDWMKPPWPAASRMRDTMAQAHSLSSACNTAHHESCYAAMERMVADRICVALTDEALQKIVDKATAVLDNYQGADEYILADQAWCKVWREGIVAAILKD